MNCNVIVAYMNNTEARFIGEVLRQAGDTTMLVKSPDGFCCLIPLTENVKYVVIEECKEAAENDG